MKKIILTLALIGCVYGANAQWSGSTTTNGAIYRDGSVTLLNNNYFVAKTFISNGSVFTTTSTGVGSAGFGWIEYKNSDGRMGYVGFGSPSNDNLYIKNETSGDVLIPGSGNVGIGRTPSQKLDVAGSVRFSDKLFIADDKGFLWNNGGFTELQATSSSNGLSLKTTTSNPITFTTNGGSQRMIITGDGNVGVGTSNPDAKLAVKGDIHCEEVRVDLSVPADYVFQKYYTGASSLKTDYTMPTLEEVEAFTKANHHLPEIPSAKTIQEDGLKLKEMTNLLLQKVEELTLYTIEQEKRIKALEAKLVVKK